MKKNIISVILTIVISLTSFLPGYAANVPPKTVAPPPYYRDDQPSESGLEPSVGAESRVFALNVGGTRFTASANSIIISGLPKDSEYKYIWFCLNDGRDKMVFDLIEERDSHGNAEFEITGVGSGIYNVEVFYSPVRYDNPFHALVWGDDIRMKWSGNSGVFLIPGMYYQNKSEYETKRTDLAALSYYCLPSSGIDSDNGDIIRSANAITAGITNDYNKALSIHDWVADNIWYDMDLYEKRTSNRDCTASNVLATRRSVCEGYTNLTVALCRAIGLPAKKVCGYGRTTGDWPNNVASEDSINHAWCEVFVDGRWVIIDPTWDSGNVYQYGAFTENEGLRGHRYFDSTQESFSADHYIRRYDENEVTAFAASSQKPAIPSKDVVTVNGKLVQVEVYNIDGYNYFKLRDIANELNKDQGGIAVDWDSNAQSILVATNSRYAAPAAPVQQKLASQTETATIPAVNLILDGQVSFAGAYTIGGATYLKLRDLAKLLGFEVSYIGGNNEVRIMF